MTIIRTKRKRHNFAIIDVTGLQDNNLSMSATGLLALLLTKPDDWDVDIDNLSKSKTDGRTAVIAALKELEKAGYLTIKKFRNSRGLFSSEYVVFETITDRLEWLEANPTEALTGEKRKKKASTSKEVDRIRLSDADKPTRINRRGKPATDIYKDLLITELPINQDPPCMSPPELGMVAPDEETHTERCAGQEKEPAQEKEPSQSSSSLVKVQEEAICESAGSAPGQIVPAAAQAASATKRERKYDSALGMRPNRARVRYLYPDGPWLTANGCIDENFLEWKARDWMKSPAFAGKSLAVVKGNVSSRWTRYGEGPANLEIDWMAYAEEKQTHAGNIKLRLDAGISIPESEQREIVAAMPAITSTLEPYAERPNTPAILPQEAAQISSSVQSSFTLPQPALEGKIEASAPATPTITMAGVENGTAYQVVQADENYRKQLERMCQGPAQRQAEPAEDVQVTPEQAAANVQRIAQMQIEVSSKKSAPKLSLEAEYQHLKRSITVYAVAKHPMTVQMAMDAHACGRLVVKFDEWGIPTKVSLPGEVEEVEPAVEEVEPAQEDGLPF